MSRAAFSRPAHCVVCDAPLSFHHNGKNPVCSRPTCQWTYRSTPARERCAVCQRPLAAHERARGACARRECEAEWLGRRPAQQRQARRRELIARSVAFRSACAPESGVHDADGFVPTPLPYNSLQAVPLPHSRREALRAHLTRVATAALEIAPSGAGPREPVQRAPMRVSSPEMDRVLIAACAACRGRCCVHGGEHAYLTEDTMRAYFDEHPESTVEGAVADYTAQIHTQTIEGSCVYHGGAGCTLPAALRADMCNTFFCESLVNLQTNHRDDEPVRAFFAPEETGFFVHGVFAGPELVTMVRRRSPIA